MSTLYRTIGATLAGSAFAATALLSGVPAATASVDHSSDSQPEYKLVIDYLLCHETEEEQGYDETYMKFDDYTVWGPENMDKGYYTSGWAKFTHDFTLSLWEDDHGPEDDEDDHLGDIDISTHDSGEDWKYGKFTDNGAHYEMKYKVVDYVED